MSKRRCLYCDRVIGVNPLTDLLRYHKVRKDGPSVGVFIVPGDPCPGSSSEGQEVST